MKAARPLLWFAVVLAAGCASTPPAPTEPAAAAAPASAAVVADASVGPSDAAPAADSAFASGAVVESLGIRLQGLRLSANGYIVDLRYRVLDTGKAQALLDRKVRPVLVDEATGQRFYVPTPPIVGALRQTARNKVIHTDRDYFMLFANPDRKLQPGSKVTLYVGEQRIGDFRIEAQQTAQAR